MLDKSALQAADTAVLIATALECCRQQQQMFGREDQFEPAWIDDFQRFEELRDYTVHQIDWQNEGALQQHSEALQQLLALDRQNRQRLEESRDDLASRLRQLRKKRDISSEYLSFQAPDGQ